MARPSGEDCTMMDALRQTSPYQETSAVVTRTRAPMSSRRILVSSLVGSTVEWFDFFLYGTAASLVFTRLYFPSTNQTVSLLLSYASFAISFCVRPFGGALFAHIGDRIGRKKTLIITLSLMGAGTTCIGALPAYQTIGLWAPILLVTLRMAQGLALGGEWGGSMLLAIENAPTSRKGFFGSIPQMGVTTGLLLSTASLAWLSRLPDVQFFAWGWRLPFLASAGLVALGLWMRSGLTETRDFADARDAGRLHRLPLLVTLGRHGRAVLTAIFVKFIDATTFYIATVFVISYATGILGFQRTAALSAICIAAVVGCAVIPLAGYLADRFSARRVFLSGCLMTVAASVPYFLLLSTRSEVGLIGATVLLVGFTWALAVATLGTVMADLFSTEVRFSGITLGYQTGVALAGGTAPLLATWILSIDGNHWRWIAAFMAGSATISAIAVLRIRPR
jgi:MFS family permease